MIDPCSSEYLFGNFCTLIEDAMQCLFKEQHLDNDEFNY